MELKFRNLTKDEIEVRVGGGKSLLLYKTARVDANVLDETVGAFNWQKRFYQVKNTMICEISINVNYEHPELPQVWVAKSDGGDDDYTMEKVKAECSDSMKRACFQWGIGRSLYTAPKIRIPDQFANSQFFEVSEIGYDQNNRICDLVITTNFGKDIVYSFKNGKKVSQTSQNAPKTSIGSGSGTIREHEKQLIKAYLEGKNSDECVQFYNWLNKYFGTMNYEMLSDEQGVIVCTKLKLN